MKLRLKTSESIWDDHKKLLRGVDSSLPINWERQLPEKGEGEYLIAIRNNRMVVPTEPLILSPEYVIGTLKRLRPQIEQVWGCKLKETPIIELLNSKDMLGRANYYQNLTNQAFGGGELMASPPAMLMAAHSNVLLIPDQLVLMKTKVRGLGPVPALDEEEANSVTTPWDRAYFEVCFSDQLSYSLLRQVRGEYGKGLIDSIKAVGQGSERMIYEVLRAATQIAKEKLCEPHKDWGLYVTADAIETVWAGNAINYIVLDALSNDRQLVRAAMVDHIEISGGEITVAFFPNHPNTDRKLALFSGEVEL